MVTWFEFCLVFERLLNHNKGTVAMFCSKKVAIRSALVAALVLAASTASAGIYTGGATGAVRTQGIYTAGTTSKVHTAGIYTGGLSSTSRARGIYTGGVAAAAGFTWSK
jgi:hypothetical protein